MPASETDVINEYDPELCVTAGELRAAGATGIPDEVPDCAWVPRLSLLFVDVEIDRSHDVAATGTLKASSTIRVLSPWRWIEATVTFDNPKGDAP